MEVTVKAFGINTVSQGNVKSEKRKGQKNLGGFQHWRVGSRGWASDKDWTLLGRREEWRREKPFGEESGFSGVS